MSESLRQIKSSQFFRFLLVGGLAAVVNLLSRYFLSQAMPFRVAILLAYLFGMTVAWALSRLFVFETTGRHWGSELLRFGLVNVFSAAQVWVISVGLAEWVFPRWGYLFHPQETAHFIGVAVPVFTSYAGHRYFSFALKK